LFDNNKRANRQETNSLLGELRTQEGMQANDERANFAIEDRRYNASKANVQAQTNSGFNNLFQGLGSAVDSVAALKAVNGKINADKAALAGPRSEGVEPVPMMKIEQLVNPISAPPLPAVTPTSPVSSPTPSSDYGRFGIDGIINDKDRSLLGGIIWQDKFASSDINSLFMDRLVGLNFNDLNRF
jgi:hypothetical protein